MHTLLLQFGVVNDYHAQRSKWGQSTWMAAYGADSTRMGQRQHSCTVACVFSWTRSPIRVQTGDSVVCACIGCDYSLRWTPVMRTQCSARFCPPSFARGVSPKATEETENNNLLEQNPPPVDFLRHPNGRNPLFIRRLDYFSSDDITKRSSTFQPKQPRAIGKRESGGKKACCSIKASRTNPRTSPRHPRQPQ